MSQDKKNITKYWSLAVIWLLYPVIYLGLEPMLGLVISAFGLFPVVAAGWHFGKWGGMIGGHSCCSSIRL